MKKCVFLILLIAATVYAAPGDRTVIGPTSGLVPKTTTVNGHALTGNVSVTAADTGAVALVAFDSYSTTTQTKITAKADKTTTINSKPLSGNITLTYTDVGAQVAGSYQPAGTYATGTGTASGTNTGDQTSVTGTSGGLSGTPNITVGTATVSSLQLPSSTALTSYVENTYTATIVPETSGTITVHPSYTSLAFTRVGRLVTVQGQLQVQAVSSPVGTYIKVSLPYSVASLYQLSGRFGGAAYSSAGLLPFYSESGLSYFLVFVNAASITTGYNFYFTFSYSI